MEYLIIGLIFLAVTLVDLLVFYVILKKAISNGFISAFRRIQIIKKEQSERENSESAEMTIDELFRTNRP